MFVNWYTDVRLSNAMAASQRRYKVGTRYQVAFCYDGSTMIVYVDGDAGERRNDNAACCGVGCVQRRPEALLQSSSGPSQTSVVDWPTLGSPRESLHIFRHVCDFAYVF